MKRMATPMIGCLVLLVALAGSASAGTPALQAEEPLVLVDTIDTEGTPYSVVVDCWNGRNDVVIRQATKVRFLDGNTLAMAPESIDLSTWGFPADLVYDRFHHQTYALQVINRTGWDEVKVHIVENRASSINFSANDIFNAAPPLPDNFFAINGVAYRQPTVEGSEYGRLIIDDTANGNITAVDIDNLGTGAAYRYRYSYGDSLCEPSHCSYSTNFGNTLALETAHETATTTDLGSSDLLYIADLNRQSPPFGPYLPGYLRALEISQPPEPLTPVVLAHVDLTGQWPFGNGNQGLAMVGPRDRLYVASGLQSFDDGYVGVVDTTDNSLEKVIELTYGDRHFVHVDWYDPKRVFVATFDGFYNDPYQGLYLHLIYDDEVVASLMLKAGWDVYAEEVEGMAFDPYHRRLYVAVGSDIMVVEVNYGADPPPAAVQGLIGPTGGMLSTPDGSAVLTFPAGSVTEDTQVSYEEIDPVPSGEQVGVRFFELLASPAAIGTPTTEFENPFTLELTYLDDELGTAIESTLGIFYWDGDEWVEEPSQHDQETNRLTASLDHMTAFAILGETKRVFLPATVRNH